MSDLNNWCVMGRLTRDAELTNVGAKNTSLTKFSIANNTGFGNYAKTNFVNVQIWGKQGENVMQYLKKGKQVAVTGAYECTHWNGQDGSQKESWCLTATSISLLADGKGSTSTETSAIPESEYGNF